MALHIEMGQVDFSGSGETQGKWIFLLFTRVYLHGNCDLARFSPLSCGKTKWDTQIIFITWDAALIFRFMQLKAL